jgi:hypothetical protein
MMKRRKYLIEFSTEKREGEREIEFYMHEKA